MIAQAGTLYIVATPIGNLRDISLRALDILKSVDYIAAEDTRHTRKLLTHFSIAKPLISLHEHNEEQRVNQLIAYLRVGKQLALVSDAGTPLISDPGYLLVRAIREAGYQVTPIPGACALISALVASGLPTDRFVFEGFLPTQAGARQRHLESLINEARTLVFYESVHRIVPSLTSMATILGGERLAVITRELTKQYETFYAGTLAHIVDWLQANPEQHHGEFVVIINGHTNNDAEHKVTEATRTLNLLLASLPLKQAVQLTSQIYQLPKNLVYSLALTLVNK